MITSLYFTVITLLSIGFGDVVPSADYQSYTNPHAKRWTDDWGKYETPHSSHYGIKIFYTYRVFGEYN